MKSFLRDLTFLALFAASVAAIVLVVALHQGRFSRELSEIIPPPQDRVAAAANPQPVTPAPRQRIMPVEIPPPAPWESARPKPDGESTTPAFEPTTRGVLGDARVLCVPEITWLQEQLSHWAARRAQPSSTRPTTLDLAHAAARRASAFDYQVSPECWNDPATIEVRGWGDCADKSLWLARELLQAGYPMVGIRLGVPEGYEPGQPGHAWVVLYHNGSEWIYDPAFSPRLMSQDAGPAKRFRVTATVFPRTSTAAR